MTLFDGPFAETREMLAGFYLIDAKDLNEAIHLAAGIPPARYGCGSQAGGVSRSFDCAYRDGWTEAVKLSAVAMREATAWLYRLERFDAAGRNRLAELVA